MYIRILIWIIFIIGGLIAGVVWDIKLFPDIWHNWIWHVLSFISGALLLKLVYKISRNTGRILAQFGKEGNIGRMQTNRLVKTGPYSCMRHPMHLGLLLFPLSFAFLSGSISFILIIAPSEILIMIIMIFFIEEPEAVRKFGSSYVKYKKEVPAFNFRINCLKHLLK